MPTMALQCLKPLTSSYDHLTPVQADGKVGKRRKWYRNNTEKYILVKAISFTYFIFNSVKPFQG
jgi:hypothetical protein